MGRGVGAGGEGFAQIVSKRKFAKLFLENKVTMADVTETSPR